MFPQSLTQYSCSCRLTQNTCLCIAVSLSYGTRYVIYETEKQRLPSLFCWHPHPWTVHTSVRHLPIHPPPPQNHLLHISLIAPAIHFQCHIVYPTVCATDDILTPTVIFKLQYYCNCNCYSFAVTIQCVMWGPTVNTQRLYRC